MLQQFLDHNFFYKIDKITTVFSCKCNIIKIMYALKMVSFPQFLTEFDEIASIRTSILSSIGGKIKINVFL